VTESSVVMELTVLEAAHLSDLVEQFVTLLADTADPAGDPAVARLVPDAYRDDRTAAEEFRRLTEADLLSRRRADAGIVLASLQHNGRALSPAMLDRSDATTAMVVQLSAEQSGAWLRTLAAVRLVLASRLGIEHDDDHDDEDPRFGIYDWVGYRLQGLVEAIER
jgi:Domain of unknown function (DUF2017)